MDEKPGRLHGHKRLGQPRLGPGDAARGHGTSASQVRDVVIACSALNRARFRAVAIAFRAFPLGFPIVRTIASQPPNYIPQRHHAQPNAVKYNTHLDQSGDEAMWRDPLALRGGPSSSCQNNWRSAGENSCVGSAGQRVPRQRRNVEQAGEAARAAGDSVQCLFLICLGSRACVVVFKILFSFGSRQRMGTTHRSTGFTNHWCMPPMMHACIDLAATHQNDTPGQPASSTAV